MQAYVHQMAACLSLLSDDKLNEESDSPAMHRLHELLVELGSLLLITLSSNPGGFKDLQNCNFEEGVVCPDAQPPSFYCSVMVSDSPHSDSPHGDSPHSDSPHSDAFCVVSFCTCYTVPAVVIPQLAKAFSF